jgi:nucleotide-binding universal stress UspA family protein
MKTILVLIGGGERDQVVFETALAAARPLSAHLDFLHLHVGAGEAARHGSTSAQFARGAGLRDALQTLDSKAQSFSEIAANNFRDFCMRWQIEICDEPGGEQHVTASYRAETGDSLDRLTFHSRHCDLLVMGRSKQKQGLAQDTLERLVLLCGRPMLVAASAPPQRLTGTVMVCWRESSNAARAVSAAMPILSKAKRVVFASVVERDDPSVAESTKDVARQFAWNGVATETQIIPAKGRKVAGVLSEAAETCNADLVVMGAYGQSKARQIIFGSVTEAFLRHADRPVLLMH